jgi:PAS domain S-box-containing protein
MAEAFDGKASWGVGMNSLSKFAYDPDDTDEVRLEKAAILLVSGSCVMAGCVWALMYFLVFGLGLTTTLPILFAAIVSSSLLVSHISKNIRYAIYSQIVCIIYITFFVQWSIGGVFESGFVLVWALCGPIVALIFLPIRQAVVWFGLYCVNILITFFFDNDFSSNGLDVSDATQHIFALSNILISSLVIFGFAGYFVNKAIAAERTLTGAVDVMAEGFAYFDNEDRLKIFNEKFALFTKVGPELRTGVRYEDLLRQRVKFGFADGTDIELEEYIEDRMRMHRESRNQYISNFSDGTWLMVNQSQTVDGGSVTALTDISELKRVENELAEKKAQLEGIVENITEGLVCYDADQRLILCNSKYREFYGYALEDVAPGTPFEDLVRLDVQRGAVDDDGTYEQNWITYRKGVEKKGTRDIELKDGRWLQVRERSTASGTVSVQTDITERKRAEGELNSAKKELEVAHRQANDLLINAIPGTIAERLKDNPGQLIADRHADVSIMFADVAGFTALSANQDPAETVNLLNTLFSEFDDVCDAAGIEKIRTIGDGYMVVGGVPKPLADHPVKMIEAAKKILDIACRHNIDIRIGINSGEVVAGIVGVRRFHYDVWGDAVNIAARMETTGKVGKIHVSSGFAERLGDKYPLKKRDPINIKGKGTMQTWFVEVGAG